MPNSLIEGLAYEIALVADGMEPGKAKAVAVLKQVEDQAVRTGAAIDKATGGKPGSADGAGLRTYQLLEAQFKSGAISAEQFAKAANYLGGNFKTLAAQAIASATAMATQATAATGAAVATTSAAVATRGLLATLGPFLVAMAGVEVLSKLVRLAWDAMTRSSREAKQKVDELTESLLRNREAARPEPVKAAERLKDARDNASAARRRVDDLLAPVDRGPGTVGVFIAEAIRAGQLAAARVDLAKKTQSLTEAERELNVAQNESVLTQSRRIAGLVEAGVASVRDIEILKKHGEEARKELRLLASAGLEGNTARQKLITDALGDPQAVQKRREELAAILKEANREAERLAREGERAGKAAETLAQRQLRAREGFATATASFTVGKEDDIEARIAKLVSAAQAAKIGATEISKMEKDLRTAIAGSLKKQGEALSDDLRSQLVATTVTAVDDLTDALEKFDRKIEESRKAGLPIDEDMVTQLRAAKVATIELTKETEALNNRLTDIDQLRSRSRNDIGAVAALLTIKDEQEAKLKIAKTDDERRKILREILKIEREIKGIVDSQPGSAKQLESNTAKVAGNVAAIANAAFGLASAFGGANSEIAKMLAGIAQVAGGIEAMSKATTNLQKIGAAGQIIGGGIAIIDALGTSPEQRAREKERIQRTQENTEAIRRLTARIGDLGRINVSGTDIDRVQRAIADPRLTSFQGLDIGRMEDILKEFGLSLQEFLNIAEQFGITLSEDGRFTKEQIAALDEAIRESELGQFPDTFAGQMAKLNAEIDLFDITDPIAQFRAFRKALDGIEGKGGILADLLDTFDLTTSEGVAAALAALQKLFTDVTSGAIDPSQFGGLTGQELVEAIQRTADLVRGAGAEGGPAGTGGFNVDRTITEVTGSRLGALLSTGNVFAEMTAKNTELIASLLSGASGGGSAPVPPVPAPSAQLVAPPGGIVPPISTVPDPLSELHNFVVTFAEKSIQVNISGGEITDPESFGRKIGRGIIEQVSQGQANALSWKKRASGNVVR